MPSFDAVPSIICVSKLARAADERNALRVFIRARPFADEDQLRAGIAHAEYDLVPAFARRQRVQSPMSVG